MASQDELTKLLLQQAVALFRASPIAGGSEFGMVDAMKMVGIDGELAESRHLQEKMRRMLQWTPSSTFLSTDEEKVKRSVHILMTAKTDADGSQLSRTKAMRLAGFSSEETYGNTKMYARVNRAAKAHMKEQSSRIAASATTSVKEERAISGGSTAASHESLIQFGMRRNGGSWVKATDAQNASYGDKEAMWQKHDPGGTDASYGSPAPIDTVDFRNGQESPVGVSIDSPLSNVSSLDSQSQFFLRIPPSSSLPSTAPLQTTTKMNGESISALTESGNHRKSSKEAHAARRDEKELEDITKSAYKVGTVLYDTVQLGENTLTKFQSAEKCAEEVNNMFGVELVSGHQLQDGLKKGLRGMSPPRRGPSTRIPQDEMKALATLSFTYESIEQANCANDRLKRPRVICPINVFIEHWMCAVINMKERRVEMYDSMGSSGMHYLKSLFQYLQDEHMDKKGEALPDIDKWELVGYRPGIPCQRNGKCFWIALVRGFHLGLLTFCIPYRFGRL